MLLLVLDLLLQFSLLLDNICILFSALDVAFAWVRRLGAL